jgi:hypothetical protein
VTGSTCTSSTAATSDHPGSLSGRSAPPTRPPARCRAARPACVRRRAGASDQPRGPGRLRSRSGPGAPCPRPPRSPPRRWPPRSGPAARPPPRATTVSAAHSDAAAAPHSGASTSPPRQQYHKPYRAEGENEVISSQILRELSPFPDRCLTLPRDARPTAVSRWASSFGEGTCASTPCRPCAQFWRRVAERDNQGGAEGGR